MQGARGPYSTISKLGKTHETFKLAMKIFPEGPPSNANHWVLSPECKLEDLVLLVTRLFKRNRFTVV